MDLTLLGVLSCLNLRERVFLNLFGQIYILKTGYNTLRRLFLPLLGSLKPHTLSPILGLHGGSLKAAEQQPMGKIAQVWWDQVTRLLLEEVSHNILVVACRAATDRPEGRERGGVEKESTTGEKRGQDR